tara:strand:- start:15870 stop:18557 length:2688 start_codon:yes stop_codon:yes gene_type:complete
MASLVEIKYNNERPWDPLNQGWIVPYIQFEREPIFYGGKWGQIANITLTGEIPLGRIVDMTKYPGIQDPYSIPYPHRLIELENVRDKIVEVFSESLKTFYFKDTKGNEMVFPNAIVESINFPASGYHGMLEYSITLKCYEQDYFVAQGIMDAKDEFQTTENENGTIEVTHLISARGINYTNSIGNLEDGLSNAIAWVNSRKGDSNKSEQGIYKAWHGGTKSGLNNPPIHLLLLDQEEKINRLEGIYEVSETFLGYLDEINNTGINTQNLKYGKKFSVDINESLNADFNVVTVTGEYKGGKESTLQELRNGFLNDNGGDPEGMMFQEAQRLSGFDGSKVDAACAINCVKKPTLFNVPYGYSVEESETDKTITIKATFDTNPLFGNSKYYFDYNVSINLDEIKKISKVTIEGQLKARGLSTERQYHIKDFLDNTDVMDYLWQRADAQHALVMKECWECASMGWVRTGIGEDINDANGYCQNLGDTLLSTEPERCHELGKSATSLSVTKNEVKNELSMSATFSDQDTLPIDDSNPNSKDYGVAGFSVEVSNPIEYVKAHPSAQPQYNGHWSIQKFGINTRAKSNVRTNLTFREDSGFAANAIEPELRSKAIEIQETLNGMLGQNEEYDISESISHKVSKADSINHTLERSYVSDDEKVICVDLPEIDSPKDCYICLDSNDQQTGDKVYATSFENAQTLCDSKGSGLNPVSCDWCFSCLDSGGAVIRQVNAADATAAQQLCPEGTVQPCDLYTADKCYKCEDNFGGGYLSEVWAASLTAAQAECDDQHLGESTAVVCPSGQGECYLCKFNGIPLATIYAHSSEEALGVCKQEYSQYDPSTITATQPCSGIGESTCYKCVTDDGQNIAIVYDSTQAGAQQQCDMAGEESIAQPCTNGGGS